MFDTVLRRRLAPVLDAAAGAIDRRFLTPDRLTGAGLILGLASAGAAGMGWWWPSLALWLTSRIADGLDGALARRRCTAGGSGSAAGGFFDITADFCVYGATVVGVAVGATTQFGAPWWPFLAVLLAYYVNGTAFLAFSSIAERVGTRIDSGRSLSFLGGLTEGAETIVVHSLWLVMPGVAAPIAVVWAVLVGMTACHRMVVGHRILRGAQGNAEEVG
ncbi:CDP-alcohol phosphatidyltransferase family protein [Williamsia sp. CHRR-6]|uniref:CDP-alcohol phosphatidyltransferase family protein n=1 Tax=Williamsia sp. CHRR-6 TaxID=2835871 RepID=UPI001BDA758C|nr:CDP-alcohol phosphatidyltransferase family protein [Williamsia sp. CHRR-6]MBT0566623.1 CDP-alcohol phosphatidyltransferase family protein [Williamsia sp. CHRR-6]